MFSCDRDLTGLPSCHNIFFKEKFPLYQRTLCTVVVPMTKAMLYLLVAYLMRRFFQFESLFAGKSRFALNRSKLNDNGVSTLFGDLVSVISLSVAYCSIISHKYFKIFFNFAYLRIGRLASPRWA